MEFTTTNIAEIATSVSAVSASAAVMATFYLYKIGRRDDKLKQVRQSIVDSKLEADRLDGKMSMDLCCSLAERILDGYSLSSFLKEIYEEHVKQATTDIADFTKIVKEDMPMVVGSFQCEESNDYENGLLKLSSLATKVEFDFPGLSVSILTAKHVLENSYHGLRKIMIDEEFWEDAIIQIYEEQQEKSSIKSYDSFLSKLFRLSVGTSMKVIEEHGQSNIDDVIKSLDIVIDEYLSKSPDQLLKASSQEKSIKNSHADNSSTIDESLRYAEKCFGQTLSQESLLMLRQLSSQINVR